MPGAPKAPTDNELLLPGPGDPAPQAPRLGAEETIMQQPMPDMISIADARLQQTLITGFAVPLSILAVAVVCKLIVSERGRRLEALMLGIEFILAALTSGLIHAIDANYAYLNADRISTACSVSQTKDQMHQTAMASLYYCVFACLALAMVLGIHANYKSLNSGASQAARGFNRQRNWLLYGLNNGIGLTALIGILAILQRCCR